jgi:ribosome-binding factor A
MADTLREEITEIVGYELEDPRVQSATVTDVRVSEDLRNANVFVLVKGTEKEIESALITLNRAATFVRQQVALSMNLRYAPQLHFARDTVEENASRINSMLVELDLEEKPDEEVEDSVE